MEEIMHRYLGIYPRMLVTGDPVTPAQAMEIIRRTDRLFGDLSTNDYPYLVRLARALRIPLWEQYELALRADQGYAAYAARREALAGEHYEAYQAALRHWYDDHARWLAAWGYIETEVVKNDWLSSQFAYGPHGWCHPDGAIGHLDSVGKGQIAEEVLGDWQRLAQAFPFLKLGVTLVREGLYDGEEDTPQVGLLVRDGAVEVVDPGSVDVHAGYAPPTRGGPGSRYAGDRAVQADQDNLAGLLVLARIFGPADASPVIPWEWIEAWSANAPRLEG
jgi:hypothetical protein